MLDNFWKQFKSGTDIRGVATDGVAGQPVNLSDEVIEQITAAFALWLSEKRGKSLNELKISIGHDSRISAERISAAAVRTLYSAGVSIIDCDLASTQSMFMTTVRLDCDGAIQITASHHPFNRNGLKFFTPEGGLSGSDITAILEKCQAGTNVLEKLNFMKQYAEELRELIKHEANADNYDLPLKGFKIIVDAGNGAGGFYATEVLAPLGADTNGSQFLEPDGMFPNHIPNPEAPEAMEAIRSAVIKSNADLGVIFDTDVDRAGCVDSKGTEINRNRLVALASAIALEKCPGGTIVTDSITSDGLKEFIEDTLGGVHYRYRRGYRNVIDKAIELNAQNTPCPLAIETSGHAALQENYFLDDGAYLITKIIIKMIKLKNEGSSIDELISKLREPIESKEIRVKILSEDFATVGKDIIEKVTEHAQNTDGWFVAPDNREGIRVSFNDFEVKGWFLLRLSVHDPILPINIESNTENGVKIIAKRLYSIMSDFDNIDITPFNKI